MSRLYFTLIILCTLSALSFSGHAELQDQGLNSIMQIIDKAIAEISEDNVEADTES